jgi:hypothetical protein
MATRMVDEKWSMEDGADGDLGNGGWEGELSTKSA